MKKRNGFTLVELVVVVLILGILAAVAAPKLMSTSGTATDNGLKQTLSILRNAIELYAAENGGTLPAANGTGLELDLAKYLRGGTMPKCPIGAKNNQIAYDSGTGTLTGDASPTQGWKYRYTTGEFIANSSAATKDGSTTYDKL